MLIWYSQIEDCIGDALGNFSFLVLLYNGIAFSGIWKNWEISNGCLLLARGMMYFFVYALHLTAVLRVILFPLRMIALF